MKLITNSQDNNFYNQFISLLDTCKSFYFNVAFINYSGLQLILNNLKRCQQEKVEGKILSSTYLNFTDEKALEKIKEFENIELKIFDSANNQIGFHPKAYIFEFDEEYKVLIGSSNLTASAFKSNIEWNIKTVLKKDDVFIKELFSDFYKLWDSSIFVDKEFLEEYKSFKNKQEKIQSFSKKEFKLNLMQQEALLRLDFLRNNGENKALAIASTGIGKTFLSVFDIKQFAAKKVLFIVHREDILISARKSFEAVIKDKTMGFFTGNKKDINRDFIFATIQTLSNHYKKFEAHEFDYIVVDEAHHIASKSYECIKTYFKPKFLLGLTATANRMDEVSIFDFFDDNLACEVTLNEALEKCLVSSFHYFGIEDIKELDYENIDLTNIKKLSKFLMINKRVDFIIEKMNFYGFSGNKRRVLGFCASKEHANFMSDEFNKKGIKSIALTSEDSSIKRENSIKKLQSSTNELEVIFTVDIFNEGIDIPNVNTVLMLRPTNSSIVFVQQLGRGLRKNSDKQFLTVLDFIGNHNRTYLIALALVGKKRFDKDSIKLSLNNNFSNFPNAHIIMDEISKKRVLEQIDSANFNSLKYLKEQYFEFKASLNLKTIPKLSDYIHYDEYINVLDFISYSKSYEEFICKVEKNSTYKKACEDEKFVKTIRFIQGLMPIKRVYEFAILKYLISNEEVSINQAVEYLKKYLEDVCEETVIHSFRFLDQQFFDPAQKQRYLKLVVLKRDKLLKTDEFSSLLKDKFKRSLLLDSLNYALIKYEKDFGIKNYGLPFLKLYEKYNMLNIAQLCNFNKIHSSFRGSGFLKYKDDFFLFITIEKDKFTKGAKYKNTFLSKELLTYSSKPSMSSDKGDGKRLIENIKHGVRLHVFVRKFSHVDRKVQGFIYLGLANTYSYKNNKPIDLELKLETPLTNNLYEEFTKVVEY
ncbi:DNA repair helicase [Arcobacter sp. CECT 8983]|nr:DNA repair helicase [Arcobacter sp. CECT 8983]